MNRNPENPVEARQWSISTLCIGAALGLACYVTRDNEQVPLIISNTMGAGSAGLTVGGLVQLLRVRSDEPH